MRTKLAAAAVAVGLLAVSCGDGDDSAEGADDGVAVPDEGADDVAIDESAGFDESQLPDDFPRDLIPPDYSSATYSEIAGGPTAAFTSGTPVDQTIAHYTELLGEPTLAVEGDPGDKNVQWQMEWLVGVVGNDSESIVTIAKIES